MEELEFICQAPATEGEEEGVWNKLDATLPPCVCEKVATYT